MKIHSIGLKKPSDRDDLPIRILYNLTFRLIMPARPESLNLLPRIKEINPGERCKEIYFHMKGGE